MALYRILNKSSIALCRQVGIDPTLSQLSRVASEMNLPMIPEGTNPSPTGLPDHVSGPPLYMVAFLNTHITNL